LDYQFVRLINYSIADEIYIFISLEYDELFFLNDFELNFGWLFEANIVGIFDEPSNLF
jgi:hypothetical protein